jgi:alpha-glucosidase
MLVGMSTNSDSTDITTYRWPEGAIVYQVYPRSFYDSNDDGIGDIPGVTEKLDYLKTFGVNAIWLSPFYPSPMADFGYDVADYCGVDPIFGNMDDMKKLLHEAHAKGIKIMVDLVPNHSSDEHEWFHQSKQSREDKYSDWYIWKDPKGHDADGNPIPPNNWINVLTGETAWEWEPSRQQFYMHSFHIKQPDLNWSNHEVREAIKDAMRFWLDLGVDGFRVDAVPFMAKDPLFRDEPANPNYEEGKGQWKYDALKHLYCYNQPHLYAYLSEMASVLQEKKYAHSERFMVTEAYPEGHNRVEAYLEFYEGMDPEVAAPFNFEGLSMPWEAEPWRKFLSKFHATLADFSPHSVASYAFGNHDQMRLVSRRGVPRARAAAVLLLTLPGMAFVYNGEELGMEDGEIPPDMIQDPQFAGGYGRDPARTPLQWTDGKNAGFSKAHRTWLPIAENYKTHNVETESTDPDSFLSLYRTLGKLRNDSESIQHGKFKVVDINEPDVLCYVRSSGKQKHTVIINFSKKSLDVVLPEKLRLGELIISSYSETKLKSNPSDKITLRAYEAAVFTS